MQDSIRTPTSFSNGVADYLTQSLLLASAIIITRVVLVLGAQILIYKIYQDYTQFLNLGPGGTPQTIPGYLRITFLRPFALKNPYLPAVIPPDLLPAQGYLGAKVLQHAYKPLISYRPGPRPKVTGIAPHRQVTQRGSAADYAALTTVIRKLAEQNPTLLIPGTSCFEKHTQGIFCSNVVNRTCQGEVCHAHPSDGSMHMSLHPADAKTVIESGWGERHPLAKGGWFTRFVPCEFVMVYAPKGEAELAVVEEIIKAAAWWVGGESLDGIKIGGNTRKDLRDASVACEWGIARVIS
ncbi:MAG: hypothetical protein M1814_006349 [Vezdaea aestivalis]|nr:MAG: hypothetical protein M1814_006349 [Vezdaea aestivalis]